MSESTGSQRRQKAAEQAIASLRLEGIEPTEETLAYLELFAQERMSADEAIGQLKQRYSP